MQIKAFDVKTLKRFVNIQHRKTFKNLDKII